MTSFLMSLLICTVTMSGLAALLLSAAPLLSRRCSARALYAAWMVIVLGFLIPYRPQPAAPAVTVSVPPAVTAPMRIGPRLDPPAAALPQSPAALPAESADPSHAQAESPASLTLSAVELVFLLWLMGTLASLGYRLTRHLRFLRTARRWSRPVCDPGLKAALAQVRQSLGIRGQVRLRVCRPVDSPMLIGLFRPTILLPACAMTPREADLVLRHELIHLRRGDLWGRVLLLIACAMHWFNPLMPFIARAAGFQCEAACDAAVLKQGSLAVRAAYGQTILNMLRTQPGIHTVLSTRYHGGKATMKKRLQGIMDTRVRKLGALLVALSFAAALLTGMAFAVSSETEETPTAIEINEIGTRIMDKLRDLYNRYGSDLSAEDRFIVGGRMGSNTLSQTSDWAGYEAAIDAVDSAEALSALLRMDFVGINQAPQGEPRREEAAQAAQAILDAMGYGDLQPTAGTYMDFPGDYVQDMLPTWRFSATLPSGFTPDGYTGPYQYIELREDLRLQSMPLTFGGMAPAGDTTPQERQFAREKALAFVEAHAFRVAEEPEVIYVSDRVYSAEMDESYTFVWIFSYGIHMSTLSDTYDVGNPTANGGVEVAVGLSSGNILGVTAFVFENDFVNRYEAEGDWVATGRTYPLVDLSYLIERVGPQIERLLWAHMTAYETELSHRDRVIALHMNSGMLGQVMTLESDWRALLDALEAVDSAESFSTALNAEYTGINQGPTPSLRRETYEAYARDLLEATGHGHLKDMSLLYPLHAPETAAFDVYAASLDAGPATTGEFVLLTLSKDGLIEGLNAQPSMIPGESRPITGEEEAFVRERALHLANTVAAIDKADCDSAKVNPLVYSASGGELIAHAFVYYGVYQGWEGDVNNGQPMGVYMQIELSDGALYDLSLFSEPFYDFIMENLAKPMVTQ